MQILARSFTFLCLNMSTALFCSAHRFLIGLRPGAWDGHCRIEFTVTEPFLYGFWGRLWLIVLLESPPTATSQSCVKGKQIVRQNCMILGGIHYIIDFNQCPWISGIKKAPKHHWSTTVFHCIWGASPFMHLCFDSKRIDAVSDQNVQLATYPLSNHTLNNQTRPTFSVFLRYSIDAIDTEMHKRRFASYP